MTRCVKVEAFTGFITKSDAPTSQHAFSLSMSIVEVTNITGIWLVVRDALSVAHTSSPFMSGIFMSSNTKSGKHSSQLDIASLPDSTTVQ